MMGLLFLTAAVLSAASMLILIGFILYPIIWILGMLGGARAVERYNFPGRQRA